ncbi:MAG TPA: dienelactone hydrolase family protein [Candidatus Binatia bacterium]|nr:dienelactone hydrolase family protein [Candidatus Binatia bacterium]
MAEKIRELYQEYQQGKISRREFMQKAIAIAGSLTAANAVLDGLRVSYSEAAQVAPDDPDILTHNVEYKGKAGPVYAFLARPVKAGKYPGIIVIHENRGLEDHIRDVARRFAKQGYVALAPDYLSRQGGTMKANPKGAGLGNIRELAPWQNVAEDTDAGFAYLKVLPDVRGDRLGLVGFCWGGEMTFATATQLRGLDAVVVYYGRSPNPLDLVKNIRAPILAHYGEKDAGVTKGIPETEAAMKKYNKAYTYKIYPGAHHAFNNDTTADRYHPEAAKEAWDRTLEFFNKNLKG